MIDRDAIVREAFGADATIEAGVRLPGGASRETWALDVATRDGGRHELILRLDSPGAAPEAGAGLAAEARLMRAAAGAGVPVPRIIACGESYILMTRVPGETIPRKILRDEAYAAARPRLARQCGQALAAIHRMPLSALPPEQGPEPQDPLLRWREVIDQLGEPHPVFELALRRLAETRPRGRRRTVVHGDFRNGNLIAGDRKSVV